MERITSRQNAIVRRFRDLARDASASRSTEVLLDGEHLLEEAIACGLPIDVAAFADSHLDAPASPLIRLAEDVAARGGRAVSVTPHVLAAMSPVQHPSGVVAIARARAADITAAFAGDADHPQLVVILAGLQDPGNVGAIVRTAAASGATAVVAVEGSASPFGWKALRGAMGGTFRVPIAQGGSLTEVIAIARAHRVRLAAAVPRGGTPLPQFDLRQPVALLLGGEGAGIADSAIAAADATVTIPMRAPVESLNVAIAAAIILYEALRQRGGPG